MSKKSKLIIGIILLAVGGGLVPTGYFMNNYFREQVYDGVPEALLEIKDDALSSLPLFAVYAQWANGTIIPEGLLSLRDPPYDGPPYFEVALTVRHQTGLSIPQCMALWNEASNSSLVTITGVNKWYGAKPGNTVYTELATVNGGLTTNQMADILEWLPLFRDKIVNTLAKDDKNLPMTPYDLGSTLFLSLGVGGAAIAVLGIIFLLLSKRSL